MAGILKSLSFTDSSTIEQLYEQNDNNRIEVVQRKPRNISSEKSRWLVLALICVSMTCTYYSYDIPSPLHQNLSDYMSPDPHFEAHFNMLYTFYSVPNVILPFFGGSYTDRLGGAICFLLFACLTLGGQFLFTLGIQLKSWAVMILGRTVYGLGGENICVAQSSLLAQWFVGKESAFSMGLAVSISRVGSVLNNMISPVMANRYGTSSAAWVGVLMNSIGVCSAVVLLTVDNRVRARLSEANRAQDLLTASLLEDQYVGEASAEWAGHVEEGSEDEEGDEVVLEDNNTKEGSSVKFSDVKRFGTMFWLLVVSCLVVYGCVLPFNNVASGILLERNYFVDPAPDCQLRYPDQCTLGTLQKGSNPSTDANGNDCPTTAKFSPVLPSSINVTEYQEGWHHKQYVYPTLTPDHVDCGDPFWSTSCTSNYCVAQNAATEKAGAVMSIPYLMSAILAPIFGFVVDKIGYRAVMTTLAPLALMIVHLVLAFHPSSSPVGPLIGQGLAYSLFAAVIWPSVPLTVEERLTGTAYGVITSVQNVGLALFPLIIAGIYTASGQKYIPSVEIFFVLCAVLGLIAGVLLNIYDRRYGGKLNAPSKVIEDKEEFHLSGRTLVNMSAAEII